MTTMGQSANGIASAFTAGMGSLFILSYAIAAKWWKSTDGRLMMVLATTVTVTCSLTLTLTIFDFSTDVDWLRFIQAGLMLGIGVCFAFNAARVWVVQFRYRKRKNYE